MLKDIADVSGVLEVEDGGVSIDWVRVFLCDCFVLLLALTVDVAVVPFAAIDVLALFVIELDSRIVVKFTGSEGLIDGAAERFLPLRVLVSVEWDLGWLVRFLVRFFFFGFVQAVVLSAL